MTAARKPRNAIQSARLKRQRAMEEAASRAADPLEQAKVYLGRRGYAVYDRRRVHGTTARGFQVGRRVMTDAAAVMSYATNLGWEGAARG